MRKRKCGKEWLLRGRTFLGWQTGYVIGMESHRYYAGVQAGKIRCRPLWGARYFATRKQAEQTVYRTLGYAGMQVQLFHVCYTLVEEETLEQRWKLYREGGRPLKFLAYREALRYQKERDLYKDYTVELYAFREKEIRLAA